MWSIDPPDLRDLLVDPSWIEAKLHTYSVAAMVQDYRKYLGGNEADGDVKLLLHAFMLSLGCCMEHPSVGRSGSVLDPLWICHAEANSMFFFANSRVTRLQSAGHVCSPTPERSPALVLLLPQPSAGVDASSPDAGAPDGGGLFQP